MNKFLSLNDSRQKATLDEWTAGRIETLLGHYFQPDAPVHVAEEQMKDWLRALSGFSREQISEACDRYLASYSKRRPTPADIRGIIVKSRNGGETAVRQGDRTALPHDERKLLEEKILPTARRWLNIPGLKDHGRQTLEYWGERV